MVARGSRDLSVSSAAMSRSIAGTLGSCILTIAPDLVMPPGPKGPVGPPARGAKQSSTYTSRSIATSSGMRIPSPSSMWCMLASKVCLSASSSLEHSVAMASMSENGSRAT